MTYVLRFPVPRHARRDGDDLLATYHRGLAQHWPVSRRVAGSALRAAHAVATARQLAGRDDLAWRDWSACWRYGLLPRELAAARRDLPGQALDGVAPAHVAKGVYQLVNSGAWPLRRNLLLDKARWVGAMRRAGLPVPPTFGAGDAVPDWARRADALILKPGFMSQGRGIRRVAFGKAGLDRLAAELGPGDVVQRLLQPHAAMAERSPGALPTVRVITCLDEDDAPEAAAVVLRMGCGRGFLDNFHGGGLAASVDLGTGLTVRAATMRAGLRLEPVERHPATGAALAGFAVPFLGECVALAKAAHRVVAPHGFDAVGWDVGLAEEGPVLIEGNWSPGTPVSQYLTGEALGASRLGALLAERLRRVPVERWRAAAALAWSPRKA